ncbi:cation-dependent mannose-6-phosphate receptor-like [Tubulanus polymorphus]|uniref:cation-dependent mannose-6-phosphate receptor-like n=1 Tax=Tubulanus polymorphus TaxID=672921 RepID=UPI003DA61022
MVNYVNIVVSCLLLLPEVLSDCTFPLHKVKTDVKQRLKPLIGKRFSATDADNKFSYSVGICTDAVKDEAPSDKAGVVQTSTKGGSKVIVGRYDNAQIMMGESWIFLEYDQGMKYKTHCNAESRRANIMLICDSTEEHGLLRIIEENTNKSQQCYYLFELSHRAVCTSSPSNGLSIGSIVVILFTVISLAYFLVGFLYQRFVVGAKGYEQIPNYSFWKDFGNLQADGCELICRSGRVTETRTYKGIGDDQLQHDDDDDDRDDHLLPMGLEDEEEVDVYHY